MNSVQQWWLDGGKPKTCAAAVKVVPYHTPMHRRLFHREEANLRALSSCQPDGRNQHEPYAPAYHAAFVDPEGTPNRRGKLIMGKACLCLALFVLADAYTCLLSLHTVSVALCFWIHVCVRHDVFACICNYMQTYNIMCAHACISAERSIEQGHAAQETLFPTC